MTAGCAPCVLAQVGAAPLVRWDWIVRNADEIARRTSEHVLLTVLAVVLGLVVSSPLALLALRVPRAYGPLLGITGALYTVPSLALFVLLIPFTGLSRTTSLIGLTTYTLMILLRGTVEGLRAVPRDVRDAAEALGYGAARRLVTVELPLALPAVVGGVRVATVTTIGLVTVTAIIGQGGLGRLFVDGYLRAFATPLLVGLVLCVALAVVADVGLLALQRRLTPWDRRPGRDG